MQKTADDICRMRKEFFNSKAECWLDMLYRNPDTGQYDLHREGFERLFALAPLKPGGRVLDAGCGSGVLVPMVLERIKPAGLLYELDFAEKMIEENRNLHRNENVRFIVGDVASAPLESEFFDTVICFAAFPHFDDKDKAMLAMSRALKSGGVLVIAHFSSSEELNRHHGACPAVMHDHLPPESEMRGFFHAAGLDIDLFLDEPGFYFIRAKK